MQHLGPDFTYLDPFFNNQHLELIFSSFHLFFFLFFTLFFSLFFFFTIFFFFLPVPLFFPWHINTHLENPSPTLDLLPTVEQKEFPLSHASLCLKNKGKDGPILG